jgi:hypothetical protein
MIDREQLEDISGKIGPFPHRYSGEFESQWPMYSFSGPSVHVWQGIANELARQGKTVEQVKDLLQSKLMRWELDGSLSDELVKFGEQYAQQHSQGWKL